MRNKNCVNEETFKAVKILNAVYKISDPLKMVDSQTRLIEEQRTALYNILKSKHKIFKAKSGHWNRPQLTSN